MSIREVQEKIFNDIQEYMDWYSFQYQNQTGVKVTGLCEADGEKMIASYIELY